MHELLAKLFKDVKLNPEPASTEALEALWTEWSIKLPEDVARVLAEHDGGEGTLGNKRPFVLWSAEQIAEDHEVVLATPGLVLFGSDGGAEAYGYLPRLQERRYGRISLLAAGAHEFEPLGETLIELVQALAAGR